MVIPRPYNKQRTEWRSKCRVQLSKHIEKRLGLTVPPSEVRLIPRPDDPYAWAVLPEKMYLFKQHMSKHSIGAYKTLYHEVGVSFEAVPADASKSFQKLDSQNSYPAAYSETKVD
ncbi:MAG: hypothetical protein M1834_005200 [Cirrosporium novae-zelandiae]|nr:MAG: hypothetical protein M1834_005200 [Cirrosporium novae-zelandiae]